MLNEQETECADRGCECIGGVLKGQETGCAVSIVSASVFAGLVQAIHSKHEGLIVSAVAGLKRSKH